jgi:uncharacterized protein with von Willebrand factor type A (vWA) domain
MSLATSASALLSKWRSKPASPAKDVIKQDTYDREMFDGLRAKAPKLDTLIKDLSREWDYAEDLMADVFADLWQGDPQLRDKTAVDASRRANHEVVQHFRNTPEREQLRPHTMHDEYGTAMACTGAGSAVKDQMAQMQAERERMRQAQEAAQQAQDQAGLKVDQIQQAIDQICGGPGGELVPPDFPGGPVNVQVGGGGGGAPGPKLELTPEQQAQIEQMMAEAQAADQAAQQAQQAADQATQDLTKQLQQTVQKAVKEQVEQAEEDQALCAAYGTQPGELQRMSFEERAALMQRLRESRLAKFSKEIGRMRLALSGERMRRVTQAREEAYSVELSGDMTRVLTSEFARMVEPDLFERFQVDLAQRRLLSRKYRGKEKLGKGAIIYVLDCSGSMEAPLTYTDGGESMTREAWGKAVGLALLDSAVRQKRDMEVILFSSGREQKRFSFPKGTVDIATVLEMTEHFFGGGTEFERPLTMALEILKDQYNKDGKPKADIVFATDAAGRVSEEFMREWLAAKERLQFRCFGIALDAPTDGMLSALSDNVRQIGDLCADEVADIFRSV